jgi:hypothetical protein
MFALAAGKARTERALDNPVLGTEGRVTAIDCILAVAVLAGLVLNAALGWWWADPAAGTCWCTTRSARCGRSSSGGAEARAGRPSAPRLRPGSESPPGHPTVLS